MANYKTFEIVAVSESVRYSISKIKVYDRKDIFIFRHFSNVKSHTSLHKDGKMHWKLEKPIHYFRTREGIPVKDFVGFNCLEVAA